MHAVAVGLALRDAWIDELLAFDPNAARRAHLDVLEVMIDDGLGDRQRRDVWRRLGARWPLLAHGVDLGIGDAAGVRPDYVAAVGRAARECHVRWYSDHAAFVRAGDVDLGHFAPLDDDPASLERVRCNAAEVARSVSCPLLLENPADILGFAAGFGGAAGSEAGARRAAQRYARVLRAADAGALLDLTNLLYDSRNDGFDLAAYLDELPWERVVEVHLAGGRKAGGLWIDSHDRDLDEDAVRLLPEVARRAPNLRAVIVERDEDLPELTAMLAQLAAVHAALCGQGRRAP